MRVRLVALSLLSVLLSVGHAQEGDTAWLVRTARMEGAASNIQEDAAALAATAQAIQAGGRPDAIAALSSGAGTLNQRVASAVLAAGLLSRE